jgi:hypothetical protein
VLTNVVFIYSCEDRISFELDAEKMLMEIPGACFYIGWLHLNISTANYFYSLKLLQVF